MAYSAGYKAFLGTPERARLLPVLEIDFPSGTERLSVADLAVDGVGHYEGRVTPGGFGSVGPSIDARSAGLKRLQAAITIADHDRKFTKLLEGVSEPRRSAARIKMAAPGLAYADWDLRFAGILHDWRWNPDRTVTLLLRTDDLWLQARVPKRPLLKPDLSVGTFVDTSAGIYLTAVYGQHDSQNLSAHGFVPTVPLRFDSGSERWDIISVGNMKSVPRVYKNNANQASGWAVATLELAGKRVYVVDWSTIPASGDVVTVDADGLTFDGATTGTLLVNPVSQIRHWLVNFGFGDWRTGAWLADSSAPLDLTSWAAAEAFATLLKLEGTLVVGGSTERDRVSDVLDAWLRSWPMFRPHWTEAGKVAMGYVPYLFPGYGTGDDFDLLREWQDRGEEGQSLGTESDSGFLVRRASASFLYARHEPKAWGSLEVQDLSQAEDVGEAIQMLHSSSKF